MRRGVIRGGGGGVGQGNTHYRLHPLLFMTDCNSVSLFCLKTELRISTSIGFPMSQNSNISQNFEGFESSSPAVIPPQMCPLHLWSYILFYNLVIREWIKQTNEFNFANENWSSRFYETNTYLLHGLIIHPPFNKYPCNLIILLQHIVYKNNRTITNFKCSSIPILKHWNCQVFFWNVPGQDDPVDNFLPTCWANAPKDHC